MYVSFVSCVVGCVCAGTHSDFCFFSHTERYCSSVSCSSTRFYLLHNLRDRFPAPGVLCTEVWPHATLNTFPKFRGIIFTNDGSRAHETCGGLCCRNSTTASKRASRDHCGSRFGERHAYCRTEGRRFSLALKAAEQIAQIMQCRSEQARSCMCCSRRWIS